MMQNTGNKSSPGSFAQLTPFEVNPPNHQPEPTILLQMTMLYHIILYCVYAILYWLYMM